MNPERREQVEAVCAEALEREGDERARFLAEACRGDDELCALVDWLLAEHAGAGSFLESPPWREPGGTRPPAAVEPLPPGTRLGPYEIDSFIGAGGMGEVYKGRDSRLGRTVAIKILPPVLAADPERRRRFEQEARAASALSHPHICTLYDVGSAAAQAGRESIDFLVMEYLAGETLAERLAKGALPIATTLSLGAQVAGALAAAHRQGIIHRDLKPGNVMLARSGGVRQGSPQAKLLDFGLAKLTGRDEQLAADPVSGLPSATTASALPSGVTASDLRSGTTLLTGHRVILGTVQYMAPEQLEGRSADARTDLWALGAILYEMLTGKPPFEGGSVVGLMVAIREREPAEIATLQPLAPPALDRLVRKCLAKDPDARWQTAADVADELRWLAEVPGASATSRESRVQRPSTLARRAAALVAAALGGLLLGGWLSQWRSATPTSSPAVERFHVTLADTGITLLQRVAVSPDGQTIAFAAGEEGSPLYVRRLGEWSTTVLEGTTGADSFCFSPDGLSVTFTTDTGPGTTAQALRRVPLRGGAPVLVEDLDGRGGRDALGGLGCGSDGSVVIPALMPGSRLRRIPWGGATREALDRPGELPEAARYATPQLLPAGQGVIFIKTVGGRSELAAFSLQTRQMTVLADKAFEARFVPATGHLVYQADGVLTAVPFDPNELRRVGEPRTLESGVGAWGISPTALAYVSPARSRLAWKDRRGGGVPLTIPIPGHVYSLALSPDGRRAVISVNKNNGRARQIYRADLDTVTDPVRLTPGDDDWFGIFTPDGRRVLFTSPVNEGGSLRYNIFWTAADGSGAPVRLTKDGSNQKASMVKRTNAGEIFLYNLKSLQERDAGTGVRVWDHDVWQQRMDEPASARALVATPGHEEYEAAFSPDGRWIAYESHEAGRADIYVKGYPDGPRSLVSPDGGGRPVWNPKTGRELFYQKDRSVLAVTILDGRRVGPAVRVFDRAFSLERNWDVAPDGNHFLVAEDVAPQHVNVVTNWVGELSRKALVR